MKTFDLDFKFKGSRDYVHGTDIFNELLDKLAGLGHELPSRLNLSMHRLMHSNLTAYLGPLEEMPPDRAAFCSFESNGQRHVVGLFENTKRITGRYAYNEKAIVADSRMNGRVLTLTSVQKQPYTNVEKVVALNKQHMSQYFSNNSGKWVFSKLQATADFVNSDPDVIELTLISNIGVRMTRSKISFGRTEVGEIYFSAI